MPKTLFKYRRVASAGLNKGRRGKHYELIHGILLELKAAAPGCALEIPLLSRWLRTLPASHVPVKRISRRTGRP